MPTRNCGSMQRISLSAIGLLFLFIASVVFAPGGGGTGDDGPGGGGTGTGDEEVQAALCGFYNLVYGIIGPLALLMVLTSATVYAAGQFFGAETRARANVWATSMLTGAIIGILIIVIIPWVLGVVYPAARNIGEICRLSAPPPSP